MKSLAQIALILIPVILHAEPPLPEPPDAAEQARIIAALRESAMRYQGHLPEFICTSVTTRKEDSSGTGARMRQRDVLEERVIFYRGREDYTILNVNGKPTKKTHDSVGGMFESGLLGMAIVPNYLFGARAPVTLQWSRWDQIDGKPAHVIAFTVAPSVYNRPDGKTTFLIGFHAFAWISASDNSLIRLEEQTDGPPGYPFRNDGDIIDYGAVDISGTKFLLPIKAVTFGQAGKFIWRNTMDFTAYGRFQTDANIKFEPVEPKEK